MKKWYILGLLVFSFVLGYGFNPLLTLAEDVSVFVSEGFDRIEPFFTKADKFYTATSTASIKLSETQLIQVKEEFNNTDRIILKLDSLERILRGIEKKI